MEDKIEAFEMRRSRETPWLYGRGYLRRERSGSVEVKAVPVPKTNREDEIKEPLEW